MFKYFIPFILTSILSANTLSTAKDISVNEPFTVTSTETLFDTSSSYTHKPLLTCNPKIDAVYKIESGSKLKVIPKSLLHTDTNYSCSYGDTPLNFKTESFKILEENYFKHEKILRLTFNDLVQSKSIIAGIKILKIDKLSKTNLNYTLLHHDGKTDVLKINETPPHAITVRVCESLSCEMYGAKTFPMH